VLVREPDALAAHVRFDEGSVETGTTARLFRHRQTKGVETDTPSLTFTAPHSYSTAVVPERKADYALADPPYELCFASRAAMGSMRSTFRLTCPVAWLVKRRGNRYPLIAFKEVIGLNLSTTTASGSSDLPVPVSKCFRGESIQASAPPVTLHGVVFDILARRAD
jgi:hypothetical protein